MTITKIHHKRIFDLLDQKYIYAAMDMNGNWYGYVDVPIKNITGWISYDYKRVGAINGTENLDWQKSIIKRNNTKQ